MRVAVILMAAATIVCAGAAYEANGALSPHPERPPQPLRTAVVPSDLDPGPALMKRIRATGATMVRLTVYWYRIAPVRPPKVWHASNPADPAYRWAQLDSQVKAAVAHGLQPILTVVAAPRWAQGANPAPPPNSADPDPDVFGQFMTAIAHRYSGHFHGLPRVRYWEAWNEPNLSSYLFPQLVGRKQVGPTQYAKLLQVFAASVREVHADNFVIAGALAPFRDVYSQKNDKVADWGPLSFMRSLLCISKTLKATCDRTVPFDAWSIHPYTSGGPTHHAALPNDVSLGDLPQLKQVLDAAVTFGHVDTSRPEPELWVTEFSWDSKPPDPKGVPMPLLTRWTSEALYRMWQNGVSVVTWFQLRDQSLSTSFYQGGLYFRGASLATAKPKPSLQAFRFPFVAYPKGEQAVTVWGRTPESGKGTVAIEQHVGRGWKRLGVLKADENGIFRGKLPRDGHGNVRARIEPGHTTSVPYSLTEPKDRVFNPFGSTKLLRVSTAKKK